MMLLLPLPVAPSSAVTEPGGASIETPRKTSRLSREYANCTVSSCTLRQAVNAARAGGR